MTKDMSKGKKRQSQWGKTISVTMGGSPQDQVMKLLKKVKAAMSGTFGGGRN